MNFQVPQFIEVEDKIFGPLTFKQFLYLVGGGGAAFMLYVTLPKYLSLIPIGFIVLLSLALAFYKVNERPFVAIMESAVRYTLNPKLYLWHKAVPTTKKEPPKTTTAKQVIMSKLSQSKLHDLSWSLDVKENVR